MKTQALLLQNCWIELFFIGYAQSAHSVSLSTVINSLSNTVESAIGQEKMSPSKLKRMSEHIWKINDFFQEINKMNLDDFEFAFLRFIVLFNPGNAHLTHSVQKLLLFFAIDFHSKFSFA